MSINRKILCNNICKFISNLCNSFNFICVYFKFRLFSFLIISRRFYCSRFLLTFIFNLWFFATFFGFTITLSGCFCCFLLSLSFLFSLFNFKLLFNDLFNIRIILIQRLPKLWHQIFPTSLKLLKRLFLNLNAMIIIL